MGFRDHGAALFRGKTIPPLPLSPAKAGAQPFCFMPFFFDNLREHPATASRYGGGVNGNLATNATFDSHVTVSIQASNEDVPAAVIAERRRKGRASSRPDRIRSRLKGAEFANAVPLKVNV